MEPLNVVAEHLEWLAANHKPEGWNQGQWGRIKGHAARELFCRPTPPTRQELIKHCGTTGCIAGWSVLLLGDPKKIQFEKRITSDSDDYELALVSDSVEVYAAQLLEISEEQADFLFQGEWQPPGYDPECDDNDPANLRAVARALRQYAVNGVPEAERDPYAGEE